MCSFSTIFKYANTNVKLRKLVLFKNRFVLISLRNLHFSIAERQFSLDKLKKYVKIPN